MSASLIVLTTLVSIGVNQALSISPIEASENAEYYDNNGTVYVIHMNKVSWREAKEMCLTHSGGGTLLEVTDDKVFAFMSQALADSLVGSESLWTGGEFTPGVFLGDDGEWAWSSSGQPINAKLDDVSHFPMTSPPFWLDRPDLLSRNRMCLSMSRRWSQWAVILAEPCTNKRRYICELGATYIRSDAENELPEVSTGIRD